MDNKSIIKDLGLSDNEAALYLSLLKLGGSAASKVAKEAGMKRTAVYPILTAMAERGFVTVYFRKGKRFYYAQRPRRVAAAFEKKLDAFGKILASLEAIERQHDQSIGLRYIETRKELRQFYSETLDEYRARKSKEYYIVSSAPTWKNIDSAFFEQYRHQRATVGIRTKLLLTADSRGVNPAAPDILRNYRYLPEQCNFKSTIDIHKDKVLIISPELNSLAVVIAIPAMVDVFSSIFEILWELTPPEPFTHS